MHPEMFPSPDELVILWETNGSSFVGFLQSSCLFIRNYVEDGPSYVTVLGTTYQQMLGNELFSKLIGRGTERLVLDAVADFFEFEYLPQLIEIISDNLDWEDSFAALIANLEADDA
jgi:hypothetical protein